MAIYYFSKADKIAFIDSNKTPIFLGEMGNNIYFSFAGNVHVPENATLATSAKIIQLQEKSVVFRGLKDEMIRRVYLEKDRDSMLLGFLDMMLLGNKKTLNTAEKARKDKLDVLSRKCIQIQNKRDEIAQLLIAGEAVDFLSDEAWIEENNG
ncbi:hypothetical protein [Rickettsia endosymbiont of Cardiosporidium cionae]|uniref:hypothetical protein n=1 Tax=Rickettsia endosymbiont of Cardiosporidium cionae TaxID=2777155 RepID=UPI00189606CE|nr:hypothetical protein [Rickettsia endosymbiont of Cardiosporidium cionae]KAF8818087.1 hypothetical protein IHI24_000886 [Rickettsia endosymbiont of Cardiosporidium cionae]